MALEDRLHKKGKLKEFYDFVSSWVHPAFEQLFWGGKDADSMASNSQFSGTPLHGFKTEFLFYCSCMCCFIVDGNVDATTYKLKRKKSHS